MTAYSVSNLPPAPLPFLSLLQMSCHALTLTCKSRPQWMQMVLQNGVTPGQYLARIVHLETEIDYMIMVHDHQLRYQEYCLLTEHEAQMSDVRRMHEEQTQRLHGAH